MALFLRMINTWWFDTWTWPWMHVYGSTNHVYCYEFIITIVGINALQYIQSIVTQTWVKQAIMFLLPVNCAVYCVTSIIAHYSSLRSSWLIVSWSVVDHLITAELEDWFKMLYHKSHPDFLHVLVSFDIWFKYVPHQWIHFSLEQYRNC